MEISGTNQAPMCQCRRHRVQVTQYTPFALRGTGTEMQKQKFHRFCEVCAELNKVKSTFISEQDTIAHRLKAAEDRGDIPWFRKHDRKRINKGTLSNVGAAVMHGDSKSADGMKLKNAGVWVWGSTGAWKSRSLSRMLEHVVALGHTYKWVRFADALRGNVAAVMSDDASAHRKYVETFIKPDVLVIDDFGCGKAKLTETGLEFMFTVIDERYARHDGMCPLWVTAQAPPEKAIRDSLSQDVKGYDLTPMVRRINEITTEVEAT